MKATFEDAVVRATHKVMAEFETQPTQRTWVGLTDDEMFELWVRADEQKDRMAFGKAVEAKLKEKNT
jgi:hypothetical protein